MLPEAYLTSIPALQNQGGFRSFVYVLVRPIQLHDHICLDKIPRNILLHRFNVLFPSNLVCPSYDSTKITVTPRCHDLQNRAEVTVKRSSLL